MQLANNATEKSYISSLSVNSFILEFFTNSLQRKNTNIDNFVLVAPIFFIFMQFSANFWPNNRLAEYLIFLD